MLVCFVAAFISKTDFEDVLIVQFVIICYLGWMIFQYSPRNPKKNPIAGNYIQAKEKEILYG